MSFSSKLRTKSWSWLNPLLSTASSSISSSFSSDSSNLLVNLFWGKRFWLIEDLGYSMFWVPFPWEGSLFYFNLDGWKIFVKLLCSSFYSRSKLAGNSFMPSFQLLSCRFYDPPLLNYCLLGQRELDLWIDCRLWWSLFAPDLSGWSMTFLGLSNSCFYFKGNGILNAS